MKSGFLKFLYILFSLSLSVFASATIKTVSQDGTCMYSTIQTAINATVTGDTVLVYPGRYFENVNLLGHNITLASLEILSGNPEYIGSTIIDGNHQNSCIIIKNNEFDVKIQGLTITNGIGYLFSDFREGGGILCYQIDQLTVTNCSIYNNTAHQGGGIGVSSSNLKLVGTSIRNNLSYWGGGGLFCWNDYQMTHDIIFDAQNKCSIYNNHGLSNQDCFFYQYHYIAVILDTCTVLNPQNYFIPIYSTNIAQPTPMTYKIAHAFMTEINHDLYVSPNGNDDNDGLSETSPLRSIFLAMYRIASDSLHPKTVHLAPGIYTQSMDNQRIAISVKNFTSLIGDTPENTILQGYPGYDLIFSGMYNSTISIKNLTCLGAGINAIFNNKLCIDNIIIEHIDSEGQILYIDHSNDTSITNSIFRNNTTSVDNSAFWLYDCRGTSYLYNCRFENNITNSGCWFDFNSPECFIMDCCTFSGNRNNVANGPIIFSINVGNGANSTQIIITNSNFVDNIETGGAPLATINSPNFTEINNCVFANNQGGQSAIRIMGNASLSNNIFWNPMLNHQVSFIWLAGGANQYSASLNRNLIRDGAGGITHDQSHILLSLNKNILDDPQFFHWGEFPYKISSHSPGIDAGTSNTNGLLLSAFDMYGQQRIANAYFERPIIDIGSYEFQGQIYANYSVSDTTGVPPFRVHFTDMSMGDISHWEWDFNGDGLTDSEEQNPNYVYSTYGYFSPSLIVSRGSLYDSIRKPNSIYTHSPIGNQDNLAVVKEGLAVYPNPFHISTNFTLCLKSPQKVKLDIFNVRGQKVRTIIDEDLTQVKHELNWDGKDSHGKSVPTGIYLYQVVGKEKKISGKMVKME